MATIYRHVLFAADFSKAGNKAAVKAMAIAKKNKAKLSVLHVLEPLPVVGNPWISEVEMDYEKYLQKELKKLGKKLKVPVSRLILAKGAIKNEIKRIRQKLKVDLIVVASHGHHTALSALIGSTASAIVQSAECDVLVIRVRR